MNLRIKQGNTLSITGQRRTAAGAAVDLTGYTVAATVRDPRNDSILAALTVTVTDAAAGQFTLGATAAQTATWPPGAYRFDVRFTSAGGVVDSTDSTPLQVLRAETR